MKTTSARWILVVLFLQLATAAVTFGKIKAKPPALAQEVTSPLPVTPDKKDELASLEQKLSGTWQGGPCVGDYTFKADGTFELRHFTPGVNTLTGTWTIRWDALPPTLIVTCKTSDFKKNDPTREEYQYLNKPLELKLLELNDEAFIYRHPNVKEEMRYERKAAK